MPRDKIEGAIKRGTDGKSGMRPTVNGILQHTYKLYRFLKVPWLKMFCTKHKDLEAVLL